MNVDVVLSWKLTFNNSVIDLQPVLLAEASPDVATVGDEARRRPPKPKCSAKSARRLESGADGKGNGEGDGGEGGGGHLPGRTRHRDSSRHARSFNTVLVLANTAR